MEAGLVRVLDTLPGMVFSINPGGVIDFVNRALADYVGIQFQSDRDWSWPIAIERPDGATFHSTLRSMLEQSQPFQMEIPLSLPRWG